MSMRSVVPLLLLFAAPACQAPKLVVASEVPTAHAADPGTSTTAPAAAKAPTAIAAESKPTAQGTQGVQGGSDDEAKKKAAAAAEEREGRQRELRRKQRDLEQARIEHKVAALDREARQMEVAAALERTAADLEAARKELEQFENEQRPRELEERRIRLDSSGHRAEHAKDELDELIAMYEADEFAKTTKELVLQRGRRSLEIAERELAVERREFAEFGEFTLPRRQRELQRKVDDAGRERRKAELAAAKAEIEVALALRRQEAQLADLEEEIASLTRKLAAEPQ